jgi:outer membrane lipoprotein carrier protein
MPRILPHVPERSLRAVFFFAALAAVLAVCGSAEAAPPSLGEIVSRVEATYNRANDFIADFVQESKIASMGKTIHEEGTVSIRKPARMLWEYRTPSAKKLVINDEKAWLYVPEERMVYVQDAPQILKSKMTIRFLAGMGKIEDAFAVAFAEEPSPASATYRLTLAPKVYEGGIKTLTATVDARTFHITAFDFTDMYGNTTRVSLSHIRINTGLPESLFQFTPPPGTDTYRVQ